VEGARYLQSAETEEIPVDVVYAEVRKAKSRGAIGPQTKGKRKTLSVDTGAEEAYEDSDDAAEPMTKASSKAKKGRPATISTTTPTTAKPKSTLSKVPARTNAPNPAASGTPASNNSKPNKYGFKPPSGPRRPRTDGTKSKAKKTVDGTAESRTAKKEAGTTVRQTRRSSATQERLEKDVEKENNIALRLRSGNGK
jgi:hypothetical protein